jgi:tRNA nucleotidyltransferase/poly(A) polymerase
MIRENASHLPVMEANQLVGIVTAQDVLRALHRTLAPPRTPAGPPERPPVHGAQLLERWLAPVQLDLVRRAGQLGDELKLGTYLIGGPVRDLLLGRGTQDLDLAVERDAHRLAQEFQARHGGKLVLHDHYRTATLGVQGHKIDFVTTRREYYEFPAARPRVDIQDVKLDLYRRDFTINAMAMRLDARHFGDLIDYYGGWRDLELKRVRVIHNLSFVDDPTRIFRALRFAGRLDFQLDGNTAALMQEALEADMLARLEPEVLFEELVSCTKEGAAERVFRLMIECGVLASLAREPGAGAGAIDRLPVIAAHLAELEQLIERFRDRAYPWLHQTLLAEPQRRQKVAERVFVPPRWLQWAESHPADLEALRAAGPAELKPLLMSRLSPPRVIALATDAPDQWPRILAAFRASSAGRRGPVVS